jgi:hypothetical protein
VYPLVFTGAAEIELAGVGAVDHVLEPNEIRLVAPGAMNLVGHGTRNDQRACRGSNRHVAEIDSSVACYQTEKLSAGLQIVLFQTKRRSGSTAATRQSSKGDHVATRAAVQ